MLHIIVKPNPDPNAHHNPQPSPTPTPPHSPKPKPNPHPSPSPNHSPSLNSRVGLELLFGSKMERNDVTTVAMNKIGGILFSIINMVVWLEGGHREVKGACDGPMLGLGGMYPPNHPT